MPTQPPDRRSELKKSIFGYDVFISYHRQDSADFAERLAWRLSLLGATVFLDSSEAPPGSTLRGAIETALLRSRHVVCILTQGALTSFWVKHEVLMALREQKTIIPICDSGIIGSPATLPEPFSFISTLVWIDAASGEIQSGDPEERTITQTRAAIGRIKRTPLLYAASIGAALVQALILVGAWQWSETRVQLGFEEVRRAEENEYARIASKREGERFLHSINARLACPDSIERNGDVEAAACYANLYTESMRLLRRHDDLPLLRQIADLAKKNGDALRRGDDTPGAIRAYEVARVLYFIIGYGDDSLSELDAAIEQVRTSKRSNGTHMPVSPSPMVLELLEVDETRDRNGIRTVRGRVRNLARFGLSRWVVDVAWYTPDGTLVHAVRGHPSSVDPGNVGEFKVETTAAVGENLFRLTFRRNDVGPELALRHAGSLRATARYLHAGTNETVKR